MTAVAPAAAACLLLLSLFSPCRVSASGIETSGIGARGRSMGYSLTAMADDWSTLYYNPAGLARLGTAQSACVYEFFRGRTGSSASLRNMRLDGSPDPARGDFVDLVGDEPASFDRTGIGADVHAGEFGWTGIRGEWGYGIGLFGSGAGSSWEDDIPLAGGGRLEGEVRFTNISINVPVGLARSFGPHLAVGGAVTLRLGKLDTLFHKERTGTIPYFLESRQETWGYGAGLDLGGLWSPSPRWSFGLVWRLPALVVRDGTTSVKNSLAGLDISRDTRVEEWIPSRVTAGAAVKPRAGTAFSLSLTWLNWSAYNRATEYEDPIEGLLEDSSGNLFQWGDALTVNFGAEQRLMEHWFLRGGLVWDQAPESRDYRTLTGGQTLDVWKAAVGIGLERKTASFDAGYVHTWGSEDGGYIPGADYSVSLHEFFVGTTWRR